MNMPTSDIPVAELMAAADRAEVVEAMRAFYTDIDRQVAERQPTCWNKGQCCQFGAFGHRLYVTALEAVCYLAGGSAIPPITDDVCPHAVGGVCQARDRRPMGCRIFYCDPSAGDWQGPMTETGLATLRTMHEPFDVPYFYADWMAVLHAISQADSRQTYRANE